MFANYVRVRAMCARVCVHLCVQKFKYVLNFSRNIRKRTFGYMRQEKIQISRRIRAVWSKSSLDAFWIAKKGNFLHADNETDQTARIRRLIWIFVGRTSQKVHFLPLPLICFQHLPCSTSTAFATTCCKKQQKTETRRKIVNNFIIDLTLPIHIYFCIL